MLSVIVGDGRSSLAVRRFEARLILSVETNTVEESMKQNVELKRVFGGVRVIAYSAVHQRVKNMA